MPRRSWNKVRPNSLSHAMELCLEFAREKHQRSVDRVADLMGLQSKWNIYKWMQSGRLPANLIRPFEHACGATFVTQYVATSAHRLLVNIPVGRAAAGEDIHALQAALTDAVRQLLRYRDGEASADDVLAAIEHGMGGLAYQWVNVQQADQPTLDLGDDPEG